jgi:hypothetical protein
VHLTHRNACGRPRPQPARNILMLSNSMTLVPSELDAIWTGVGFFSLHSLSSSLKISLIPVHTYVISATFPSYFRSNTSFVSGPSHRNSESAKGTISVTWPDYRADCRAFSMGSGENLPWAIHTALQMPFSRAPQDYIGASRSKTSALHGLLSSVSYGSSVYIPK